MKKNNFLFIVIAIFLMVFTSCEKDEDELTVSQNDIVGTWEVTGGDDFTACENGDNKLFVISLTQIQEGQTDSDGCQIEDSFAKFDYEYKNGNSLDVGIGVYEITHFKDNKMTFEVTSPLAPGLKSTINLAKIKL